MASDHDAPINTATGTVSVRPRISAASDLALTKVLLSALVMQQSIKAKPTSCQKEPRRLSAYSKSGLEILSSYA